MRTAMSTATPEMISQSGGSTVLFFIYPKPHSVIVLFFFFEGGKDHRTRSAWVLQRPQW